MMRNLALTLPGLLVLTTRLVYAQDRACETARFENKTRIFATTDISNEPDDQMSLVRFLTHANEIDIVNIAAATSTHLNDTTDAPAIYGVIDAYAQIVETLNAHVPEAGKYPSAEDLRAKVVTGQPVYGLAALDASMPSNASEALINATDSSEEPLWVLCWGGCNILAEALNNVRKSRTQEETVEFIRKLRVYSISDQDNAGPWIRVNFPTLFYIVSIHGFSDYTQATWIGIAGDLQWPMDAGGPDTSIVTNEWLQKHIRIGPLGAKYLRHIYIMEGDTPSFLGLLPNGLNTPEHPEYGGWGGRYRAVDSSGLTSVYSDTQDFAIGKNNGTFRSQYASIWRWREAFQFDLAARMQWSVQSDYAKANHIPVVVVNESCSFQPLELTYAVNGSVVIDASQSWDPDGDQLSFDFFHYREISLVRPDGLDFPRVSDSVIFTPLNEDGSLTRITPTAKTRWGQSDEIHIILTVKDARPAPLALTAYKRFILRPEV